MPITMIHRRAGAAASLDAVGPNRAVSARVRRSAATIGVWIARSRQRGALRELAERSDRDHLLDDIGVTPELARRACAKWFWQP